MARRTVPPASGAHWLFDSSKEGPLIEKYFFEREKAWFKARKVQNGPCIQWCLNYGGKSAVNGNIPILTVMGTNQNQLQLWSILRTQLITSIQAIT